MAPTPVPDLPEAPSRTQAPSIFIAVSDAWVAFLQTWTDAVNVIAAQINALAIAADTSNTESGVSAAASAASATESAASAASSEASANFEGEWSTLTGALAKGVSVLNNGVYWLSLVAIADVTLSEPTSSNSEWEVTQASDKWDNSITAPLTITPYKKQPFDVTGGDITATIPATISVGDPYRFNCFDSVDGTSGNIVIIARNGHVLYGPDGVTVVDAAGDGNLGLEVGDYLELFVFASGKLKVV